MKDVIVFCAILPLTLSLILLIGYNQRNGDNESYVRETIYYYAQEASLEGYFSNSNIDKIKDDIASRLKLDDTEKDKIKIITDSRIKYRPEIISYTIEVPVKNFLPTNKLFGISDEDNIGKITVESKIMSERLAP